MTVKGALIKLYNTNAFNRKSIDKLKSTIKGLIKIKEVTNVIQNTSTTKRI